MNNFITIVKSAYRQARLAGDIPAEELFQALAYTQGIEKLDTLKLFLKPVKEY